MRIQQGELRLSATDLSQHLGCTHLTQLDRAAAEGRLEAPIWTDLILEMLKERGIAHEDAYAAHLGAEGHTVVEVGREAPAGRVLELMEAGTDVILQAPLADGLFSGFADFLIKVPGTSNLGDFRYEVIDTKLSLKTRAGTILQLCMYTEAVAELQGAEPELMHVVKPGEGFERESFRTAEVSAYSRHVKRKLEAVAASEPDTGTYPVPVPQCDVCRWWHDCDKRRRKDDHLSLVAGMSTLHTAELNRQGVTTLTQFGEAAAALPDGPSRGSREGFERLHAQARIQVEGRKAGEYRVERLPLEEARGLQRLPAPSPGDLFFDIEAARFHEDGGLEYLLGWCSVNDSGGLDYQCLWAEGRDGERRAFEEFMETVMSNWESHPDMHVYHFAPYEPAALKRLMGRHGCCSEELDRLLRGGRLVDLHAVARQGIRASVEQYSLKDLEQIAGFTREVDLRESTAARRRIETCLDAGDVEGVAVADRDLVEGYNREDCEATSVLRDWLESQRQAWLDEGVKVPRPELADGEASEIATEVRAEVKVVQDALMAGLPEEREDWTVEQRALWVLAQMLEYHRREMNCAHWEFFRLHDLDPEELWSERKTLAGLRFVGEVGGTAACPVHRYEYPDQESAVKVGGKLHAVGDLEQALGEVAEVDPARGTIDIKKKKRTAEVHSSEVMVDERVSSRAIADALRGFAESVVEHGLDGEGPFRAGRDLLLGLPPRLQDHDGGGLRKEDESALDAARRLARSLDSGYLPIQGPPGTGKTFTGARMIVDLARSGKRVGVTAVSHKVILNLIDGVHRASLESGRPVQVAHKAGKKSADSGEHVLKVRNGAEALQALDEGYVVGGTAWLWVGEGAEQALDYLFVDEAGQMALADVLAISRAAENIVLLGDPQQLEQPQQGSHPEGSEVAALVHALGGAKTVAADRGLFLDRTWRLHPSICRFNSELYYDGRLEAEPGNERQEIVGPTPYCGSGLRLVPVAHEGNQSSSREEVEAVERIVGSLLQEGVTWTDREGANHPLRAEDILIVTPYNAQIGALQRVLPHMKIGTVDRFQGQEAPVVIYTMAASSAEDAPRGMSFLFNPNRLNVAISRARALCILVASPRLFDAQCRTPDQMQWANGLCRYAELARST